MPKGILCSTVTVHRHSQEMARCLQEEGQLQLYHTSWLHAPKSTGLGEVLEAAGPFVPGLRRGLEKRRLQVPEPLPMKLRAGEEFLRLLAETGLGWAKVGHMVWDRQQKNLSEEAVRLLQSGRFSGYLGLEYGALEALKTAKQMGIRTCLVFTSPHHAFWDEWAKRGGCREEDLYPSRWWKERLRRCYARIDEEMQLADLVRTNSELVGRSLEKAGLPHEKVVNVPLGADIRGMHPMRERPNRKKVRFMASGQVSLRKGAHLLIEAWRKLKPAQAELHFYGGNLLPERFQKEIPAGITFHGSKSRAEVVRAYEESDVLVFPTLCDGFGMVVPEAMTAGCAVITTRNAGAADWIEEGKNGWVVEAASAEALAEGMQKALDADGRLDEMRAKAQETAKRHTWENFRQRFAECLYEEKFLYKKS